MIDLSPVPTVYEHFRSGTAASEEDGRPPPTQKKLVVTEAFFSYTTMEQLAGSERSVGLHSNTTHSGYTPCYTPTSVCNTVCRRLHTV